MKRRRVALIAISLALVVAGCTTRTVTSYSDSILTRSIDPEGSTAKFAPPAGESRWYGDFIVNSLVEDSANWKITVPAYGWHPQPGTEMDGVNANSFAAGLDSNGTTTVLYSFGTNDANYFAWGTPGSHTSAAAKLYALRWMDLAFKKNACVVWILGNEQILADHSSYRAPAGVAGASSGEAAAQTYHAYMQDFNGWLRSLGGTVTTPTGSKGSLRTLDWGAIANADPKYTMADRVHPSQAGADLLGKYLNALVKQC
jgi:hypothetical protein